MEIVKCSQKPSTQFLRLPIESAKSRNRLRVVGALFIIAALLSARIAVAAPSVSVSIVSLDDGKTFSDQQISEAFSRIAAKIRGQRRITLIEFSKKFGETAALTGRCSFKMASRSDSFANTLLIVFLPPRYEYDLPLIEACARKRNRIVVVRGGPELRPNFAKVLDTVLLRAVKQALSLGNRS